MWIIKIPGSNTFSEKTLSRYFRMNISVLPVLRPCTADDIRAKEQQNKAWEAKQQQITRCDDWFKLPEYKSLIEFHRKWKAFL